LLSNHGALYFIIQQLKKLGHEVIVESELNPFIADLYKAKTFYHKFFTKQSYLRFRDPKVVKFRAKIIDKLVAKHNPDLIFSPGSLELAYLKSTVPKIFWTDATFRQIRGYYPNLSEYKFKLSDNIELETFNSIDSLIFSNQTAAASAINDYNIAKDKVHFVNFGPCIDNSFTEQEIINLIDNRINDNVFKMLFVGIDPYRKGLDFIKESLHQIKDK
jgi:hypothetical protein